MWFDGIGLCSSKEYKCMRSCISLVLLVLDVINHNVVRVLFYEGTSWYCLLSLILYLHCPCTTCENYSWLASIFMGSPDCLQSCARNASRHIHGFKSIHVDGKMISLICYIASELQKIISGTNSELGLIFSLLHFLFHLL